MKKNQQLFSFGDVPYASPYNVVGKEICRNFYVEPAISQTSKVKSYYVSVPGLKLSVQSDAGNACRGLYRTSDQRLFQCHSNYVDEIFQNGQRITRGYITTYSGVVNFSDNTRELLLVDGQYGYILDLATNTFSKIDENTFPNGASFCTCIDNYFLVNKPNTKEYYWSGVNNGTSWDPLDFATKEGYPEVIVAIKELNNQLWVFGSSNTEIHYDSTDFETQVWKRIEGGILEIGCVAPNSVTRVESNIFWLGSDKSGNVAVWSNTGISPKKISIRGIEQLIQTETGGKVDDAIGYTYSQQGHVFYVLQFMSSELTLVYDNATNTWHVRSNRDWRGNNVKWRGIFHQYIWGRNMMGDLYTNALYTPDMDYYYNDDPTAPTKPTYIVRERTTPILQVNQKMVCHASFEVLFEMGTGNNLNNALGFGQDPQVMINTSDDSGISWSNFKYQSIGKIGETTKRAKFNRLGISRNRVYKVTITEPVKVVLLGFVADLIERNW